MVINSIGTIELENIQILIPSNRSRPQSVPILPSKSSKQSPNRTKKERKHHPHRQVFVPDKPPFVNYASAYIDPYRYLTPIPSHHGRSKTTKRSKRKKQVVENSVVKEEQSLCSEIIQNTNPVDLWPLDPDSFDMDFIRQRQITIENSFYRETIDTWKPVSLHHLVTLIKDLTRDTNRVDRVWVIFYWISQNIFYTNEQKSEDIFQSRKATCEGYATIFQTLCEQLGLNSRQIIGYAKDAHFYLHQRSFSHPNHTWNAVQLDDNHWYLLDSSWGSGYLNNQHKYQKSLQTYYFLTRPETLIYTHLPKDPHWQSLAKSISMFDYFRLPYLHSYYFLYDLTLLSPRFSSIVNFDSYESLAEVLIQAPNDIHLTCSSKDENRSTCLTQYDGKRQIWQCLFAPYRSGFYTLIIYANRLSLANLFLNVIELGVEISIKDFQKRKILPITFKKFIEYKCQIYSPLDGKLRRGMKVLIHCRIPNASYGRITLDGIWLEEVMIKDDIFKQEIIVPERDIIIYAQFIHKKSVNCYSGLIRYLVEK